MSILGQLSIIDEVVCDNDYNSYVHCAGAGRLLICSEEWSEGYWFMISGDWYIGSDDAPPPLCTPPARTVGRFSRWHSSLLAASCFFLSSSSSSSLTLQSNLRSSGENLNDGHRVTMIRYVVVKWRCCLAPPPVLQSEGAPCDEGLLGTELEAQRSSETLWRPDHGTRVHHQYWRSVCQPLLPRKQQTNIKKHSRWIRTQVTILKSDEWFLRAPPSDHWPLVFIIYILFLFDFNL